MSLSGPMYNNSWMYLYIHQMLISFWIVGPSCLLAEQLVSSTVSNPTPAGSVQDFSDESSEVSQSSYLTEKDLKPPGEYFLICLKFEYK